MGLLFCFSHSSGDQAVEQGSQQRARFLFSIGIGAVSDLSLIHI